jgi:diguanylate cyclase (GGDEF)-like protein
MVDIDRFKNINDRFGHPLGDVVLLNLAKICQEQLRVVDIFGRVGGEEFLAILPETDAERAYEIAERLRKHIAATSCGCFEVPNDKNGDKHDIRITVSLGLATFSPANDHQTQATLVLKKCYDLCDKAMYRAKQAGRNQVSV